MAPTPFVLVVADEAEIRELVTVILEQEGYRVVGVANARAALDIMATVVPDLLFTDTVMPGAIDGFPLAKIAKARYPGIKVLMTTSYDFMVRNGYPYEREFVTVLHKPYRAQQLIREVANLLAAA
jgi:CheY-like chemotaxis protein